MYVIVCISFSGKCADYGFPKALLFDNKEVCEAFTDKLYKNFLDKLGKEGLIVVDGKAFCLRFVEGKEI